MDKDLYAMTREDLIEEVIRLRTGIREGWENQELNDLLPEYDEHDRKLSGLTPLPDDIF